MFSLLENICLNFMGFKVNIIDSLFLMFPQTRIHLKIQ